MNKNITIQKYHIAYASELVKMWRRSFRRAIGVEEHNRYDDFSGQLRYFLSLDPEKIDMVIDLGNSRVVGFMVLDGGSLDQLYVDIDYQGMGIGTQLLKLAFERSPAGLELYTFQLNKKAQAFYLSRGFEEIERGTAGKAGNPWATDESQLRDIKYRWLPKLE